MIIRVIINSIMGFAIQPYIKDNDIDIIAQEISSDSKVAFIDLCVSDRILKLVDILVKNGVQVVGFYDHHLDPKRENLLRNICELEQKVQGKCSIVDRSKAFSCSRLIDNGEWNIIEADVVFFHADYDGYLSFLKGANVVYPGLDNDADILEGARIGKKLTSIGKLLANSISCLVPPYNLDPEGYIVEKQKVFQLMANWIHKGYQWQNIKGFSRIVNRKAKKAEGLARFLAWNTDLLPYKVSICDFRKYIRDRRPIFISIWRKEVIRKFGPVLLCSIGIGHLGEQVYIELPREWKGKIDLREFLPEGGTGFVPFRIQIPLDKWSDFYDKWSMAYPYIFIRDYNEQQK